MSFSQRIFKSGAISRRGICSNMLLEPWRSSSPCRHFRCSRARHCMMPSRAALACFASRREDKFTGRITASHSPSLCVKCCKNLESPNFPLHVPFSAGANSSPWNPAPGGNPGVKRTWISPIFKKILCEITFKLKIKIKRTQICPMKPSGGLSNLVRLSL
jgi:hypothetical protein